MSPRKKTRTRSTDNIPPRHIRKLKQIKREVAAEAARIIATEGQYNYHAAKRKAADRIGVSERLALPANLEVQEALQAYLQLYGGDRHRENLGHMRAAAIEAMRFLQPWPSRLVGAVLDGTAGQHARITLHVFCDGPDSLVHHLMERGVPFRQEQRQIRWHDGAHRSLPLFVIERDPYLVEMLIFDELQLRQSPPCPIDGKPQRRATVEDIERLLDGPEPQAALG
ncbi:MAG: hypothetical protein R3212_11550 [Xanthomonadales bacterium]|nr:hypothetical protein [Xanthomonadales bacterium]